MAKKLSLSAIAATLQAIPSMDVSDRNVIDVSEDSMPVVLTIGQIFTLVKDKKLKKNLLQRNDELRREMGRAKHVTNALHAAHLDVVVAYYDGGFHLIDGCHRIGHWIESLGAHIPSHVTVLLKRPQTEVEYFSLYRAYDSAKAGKTKRDFLYGYMRHLGFDSSLASPMFQCGAFVTAFNNLGCGISGRSEVDTMRVYRKAVQAVDSHKLKVEEIPQGFVLAAIQLYHTLESAAPVKEYVNELIIGYARGCDTISAPTKKVFKAVALLREKNGDSLTGESISRDVADVVEHGFDQFCTAKTSFSAKTFARKLMVAPSSSFKLA